MTTAEPAGPPSELIIGLDVGTTATKAVAFEIGSARRHTAIREYPLLAPRPGWQVQDPDAIRAAVLATLAECVAAAAGGTVVAVAVSTAMHGLIGLDGNLEPMTPLVTWADARSRDEAQGLRATHLAGEVYRTSGTPVHPMTPLTKLMWFTRNEPELCARVRWWAGLKDLVLATLTGALVTELSTASGTAMLDLSTRDWNPAAIELARVHADQLPPILPTTSVLELSADVAARVGLPSGTPVVVGAGDGPLGNLGTQAMTPGVAGLSLGTSGALRMVVPEPVLDPDGRLFCYALTDSQWIVGGAVSNGGIVVRWAGDVFGHGLAASGEHPDAELLALAQAVPPGCDGLLMLPYLLPERAPLWDPDVTGAFLGIRHGHTRGHFVRAALEGVALQLSVILEALDRIEPVNSVRATGGVFRSVLWRRVLAAALGRPVTVTGAAEGSALGVAALGLFALGRAESLTSAVEAFGPERQVRPVEIPEVASPSDIALYAGLRASVPSLLAGYDEIGRLFAANAHVRGRSGGQLQGSPHLVPDVSPSARPATRDDPHRGGVMSTAPLRPDEDPKRRRVMSEQTTAAAQAVKPVVTLFEQYGAGASYVGRKVAEALGLPFHAQAFSSEEIESSQAEATEENATLAQVFSVMGGAYGGLEGRDIATTQRQQYELVMENNRTVHEFADEGGVIVGRNGAVILAEQPSTVHVLLTGSVEDRIKRAANEAGISLERAAQRQKREDEVRSEMSITFYGWDPRLPDRYDLVFNTSRISLDRVVDAILAGVNVTAD